MREKRIHYRSGQRNRVCPVQMFPENGWQVFAGRFMKDWTELDTLKVEYGNRLTLVGLDVGDSESVRKAAETVGDETDNLDMLVNCAGIAQSGGSEAIASCLNVNAFGPIRMVEAFLPLKLGDDEMSKIVLCIDNRNSHFEETKRYLESCDCTVYTVLEKEQNMAAVLEDIDRKEGKNSFR